MNSISYRSYRVTVVTYGNPVVATVLALLHVVSGDLEGASFGTRNAVPVPDMVPGEGPYRTLDPPSSRGGFQVRVTWFRPIEAADACEGGPGGE